MSEQPSLFDALDAVEPVAEAGGPTPADSAFDGFALDADHATRRAIVERLDETMFVEAGAGSGKTKSLVDRIVALVTVAGVPMREIVAVTFTEKAASELRDRVRRELERVAVTGSVPERQAGSVPERQAGSVPERQAGSVPERHADGERSARAATALDDLDGAAVSTLHAFAQRILVEHPVEAGLPPRIEVLDDIASQVAFDERWSRFVDQLLDDRTLERSLLLALSSGTGLDALRSIALACNANWDLVAQRMGPEPDPPPLDAAPIITAATELVARAGDCRDASDRLATGLAEVDEWARELRDAPDEYEQLRLLHDAMPKVGTRIGRKENWSCDIDTVRAQLAALLTLVQETDTALAAASVTRLTWAIAQFTLVEVEQRRRGGRLEFHDLLVLSRAVLRDPERGPDVRRRLRDRYTRLLLDEFQDTDPIQGDLAVLLASSDPDAADRPCNEITTDPGRLFVVGDPKQSIYRFRRADIAAFLRMRDSFAGSPFRHGAATPFGHGAGASVHRLTRNFRSAPAVIEFVNHVFVDLIVAEPDSQPEYVALDPERDDAPPGRSGAEQPAVVLLGAEPHPDVADPVDLTAKPRKPNAGELRDAEAADVAAVVRAALDDGWLVTRRTASPFGHGAGDGTIAWEPCRAGDIAILLPARTSLGQLEDALDAAGIPYRAETSSLVYGTPEIRNLLLTLRAIDDPTDELALVSALRSPLFGCGDDDLYTYKVEHGGSWNHQAPLPESLPLGHPVGDALHALAGWYDARLWLDASELLDRIVRDRRVLEAAFVHGRPRDLWRRVRFVIDQARAFAEARTVGGTQGSSLRDFLAWADLQSAEGARVVETVLPETDDDAVRILTIHGAKGLEFPIAIVSGTTTAARTRRGGVQLLFPHDRDTYALRVSARVTTEEFDRYEPIDEQMDFHEKLRLLYVGLTRARDDLVVSVHRTARPPADDRTKWTHAELLWSAAQSAPHWRPLHDVAVTPVAVPGSAAAASEPAPPVPPWTAWVAERDAALAAASVPRVRSATAIARDAARTAATHDDPGLRKGPRDLELPPWNKGRYGTAVGRAVHAVLQTVDLATGAGIDAAAAAQAASEGVIGKEADIAALARAALDSDVVRDAVAGGYRREMYVAAPIGGRLLEGYVDLVHRATPPFDGLVVVDYKTDAWHDDADLDAKLVQYRLQGASYALALAAATGEAVAECVFVFLRPGRAVTRRVTDLPAAMAEVRAVLEASAAAG